MTEKLCSICHASVQEGARFCANCGASVVDPSAGAASHLASPPIASVVDQAPKTSRVTPGFLIAAAITFILALGTPRLLLVVPVLAAVVLAVVSLARRESYRGGAVAVIAVSLLLFIDNAADLAKLSAPASTVPTEASPSDTAASSDACSPSDFSVRNVTTAPAEGDYIRVTGIVHSACSSAMGVQLKWTGFNPDGSVAFSDDFWPDSTTNLSPNSDFPFEMTHEAPSGAPTYKVEVVSVTKW